MLELKMGGEMVMMASGEEMVVDQQASIILVVKKRKHTNGSYPLRYKHKNLDNPHDQYIVYRVLGVC